MTAIKKPEHSAPACGQHSVRGERAENDEIFSIFISEQRAVYNIIITATWDRPGEGVTSLPCLCTGLSCWTGWWRSPACTPRPASPPRRNWEDDLPTNSVQLTETIVLHWTGLDWTGLDWTGLDWTGLVFVGKFPELYRSDVRVVLRAREAAGDLTEWRGLTPGGGLSAPGGDG